MGGMGGMRLKESLCLTPSHTTSDHWYSEPSPQNFPVCLLSNNVISAYCVPSLLLCFVSVACYGLSAFIFAVIFKAYLKFHLLQRGNQKRRPLKDLV